MTAHSHQAFRSRWRRWRPFQATAALALFLAMPAPGAGVDNAATPGVLILHSYKRPTPAQIIVEDTLRATLPKGLRRPVELFSEHLDDERTSLQTHEAIQAELLRAKYRERNVRVIVAHSLPALQFVRDFRERILPHVPVVHVAVARDRLDGALPSDIVGNFEDNDPTPTLKLAMRLHPGTERIVVIRGASERDLFWDIRLRAALQRMDRDVKMEYLAGLSTADVLRRVSTLSRGTVVFTPGYFVDGAGQVGSPQQSTERIAAASAVPVYGTFDTFLGTGIVGGYMSPYEDQAKEASAIVIGLLNGGIPSETPSSTVTRVPMVDWRQVRRWGIDERLLPAGTVVKFREPSAWDKYWREISAGVAVVLLQAALIAVLLLERRSRRRTAAALEESQKQMTVAASAARLSLWIWDAAREKIGPSGRLRHHPGASKNEPTAFQDVVASAHPSDREGLERAVAKALSTDEELDVEYRVVEADGSVRWVAARGRAESSGSQRLLGVALDVTERKTAELRAAQDRTALRHMTRVSTVGQLSAAIAHQLNQPLAAILGNAEAAQKMLGRGRFDLAEVRQIFDDIVNEDRRAADVIRRLSELYRRGDVKTEPIDVNELIRETLDLLRTELLIRHVILVTDLSHNMPMIDGGRVQLQQVVMNLVLNAADAMGGIEAEDRRLVIRTESRERYVRLCVVDNGSGIAAEHLKSVFDPFWSTKPGGMGMGLAISRSIVEAHGGSIEAGNNAEGGATFCIALPVKEPVSA